MAEQKDEVEVGKSMSKKGEGCGGEDGESGMRRNPRRFRQKPARYR